MQCCWEWSNNFGQTLVFSSVVSRTTVSVDCWVVPAFKIKPWCANTTIDELFREFRHLLIRLSALLSVQMVTWKFVSCWVGKLWAICEIKGFQSDQFCIAFCQQSQISTKIWLFLLLRPVFSIVRQTQSRRRMHPFNESRIHRSRAVSGFAAILVHSRKFQRQKLCCYKTSSKKILQMHRNYCCCKTFVGR